jgi:hypothetical protein
MQMQIFFALDTMSGAKCYVAKSASTAGFRISRIFTQNLVDKNTVIAICMGTCTMNRALMNRLDQIQLTIQRAFRSSSPNKVAAK